MWAAMGGQSLLAVYGICGIMKRAGLHALGAVAMMMVAMTVAWIGTGAAANVPPPR
ncbi:hypothetical protein SBA_ch1_12390 [Sphingomonas bisphenolicum]|uniref:Uncharacterized protein n=1 Tax=Sphingomonas bisphenolicum TaxID=296544 RepID=A0ABM7FZI4_9SPHN|nr:hypothetical protein SBA_ch1_12390 [Sphingomonas bisphenolicum]